MIYPLCDYCKPPRATAITRHRDTGTPLCEDHVTLVHVARDHFPPPLPKGRRADPLQHA